MEMRFDQNALGNKVRFYREKLGLKQLDLAKLVDISPSYISAIEHGKRASVSYEVLTKLCEALHVSIDDMLADSLAYYNSPQHDGLKSKIMTELNSCDEGHRMFLFKVFRSFNNR
mgnify:CR=1 FL=1